VIAGPSIDIWVSLALFLKLYSFLAAYITDASLVGAANRPHFSYGYIPSMLFSLDHSVWFHDDDFRADEWLLYENFSPMASKFILLCYRQDLDSIHNETFGASSLVGRHLSWTKNRNFFLLKSAENILLGVFLSEKHIGDVLFLHENQ
jgi:hypothetical protein